MVVTFFELLKLKLHIEREKEMEEKVWRLEERKSRERKRFFVRGNEKGMLPGLATLEFLTERAAAKWHKTQDH
jgi:hypothetical protein